MNRTIIEGYAEATVDAAETQHGSGYAGIEDASVALGPDPRVEVLWVNGELVAEDGELYKADELEVASGLAVASRDLRERVDA